jgi:hypothetical protein
MVAAGFSLRRVYQPQGPKTRRLKPAATSKKRLGLRLDLLYDPFHLSRFPNLAKALIRTEARPISLLWPAVLFYGKAC